MLPLQGTLGLIPGGGTACQCVAATHTQKKKEALFLANPYISHTNHFFIGKSLFEKPSFRLINVDFGPDIPNQPNIN